MCTHAKYFFFFLFFYTYLLFQMRQNASGGPVRPSLLNGPIHPALPSPSPGLQNARPHPGPHRSPCPPQPLANGPVGTGSHGPLGPPLLSACNSSSSSNNNNNQWSPAGPNGDVPYLQPAPAAVPLPHTCTSTTTQDSTLPRQALHLSSSQVSLLGRGEGWSN